MLGSLHKTRVSFNPLNARSQLMLRCTALTKTGRRKAAKETVTPWSGGPALCRGVPGFRLDALVQPLLPVVEIVLVDWSSAGSHAAV